MYPDLQNNLPKSQGRTRSRKKGNWKHSPEASYQIFAKNLRNKLKSNPVYNIKTHKRPKNASNYYSVYNLI